MKALTISEAFRAVIGDREVVQAFFTTYSFEPDFFELEVLPLLLGNPALSSNESIRYYQLQSLMRQHAGRLAVVYDLSVFDPQLAPRLEVDYLPMRVRGACQHAKLMVLIVRDRKSKQLSIVLGAGSFNLTKAGWWENLEVGHWVELSEGSAPGNILEPLIDALRFYQAHTPSPVLDNILGVAMAFEASTADPNCTFYFSGNGAAHRHFDTFIAEHADADAALEIISPFFADDGNNRTIIDFLGRYSSATVLLPLDEQGQALVDRQSVYEALPRESITWGQWCDSIRKSHLDPKSPHRRLHAKIYQAHGEDPWCFVGSVNLSFKAFRQNIEAGFLLKGGDAKPLLVALKAPPDRFKVEVEASSASAAGDLEMPPIRVAFDWQTDLLHTSCSAPGELVLLNSAAEILVSVPLSGADDQLSPAPQLKTHLQGSSLMHARWLTDAGAAEGTVLVSQRNLFCRPTHLPALDLQALLKIFIGMHESRRLELFGDLAVRLLHASQDDGVQDEFLPEPTAEGAFESFFAEFSQVNGAFWELAERLAKAEREGDFQTLAYYLKGQQPDSLRKVLASIVGLDSTNKEASLIVRYLTLLSVTDLLKRFAAHADEALIHEAEKALTALERNELLTQLDGAEGEHFIRWFKTKFFEPVAAMTRTSGEGYSREQD
ncbi:hypothetical protein EGJ43_19005 [Stutzerimonas stutzeri]|uniref:phospholipase D-like domain-containing protein n=1 Tax=Stutzerimonas stutzeri TaxID=316 RepID=UPI000F73BB51|nr:phospholipase D-like domain-containing protein [Stutzerimonas stutzeri]RRW11925.1 hypothetical protein EGJ43_19005 [Stutzerimonas stutzeri]